ncbi:hypothetical protein D5086_008085 [Populus alba]|uniref:Uncharacterized protein n=1 Tax=Populus alba TaxID=43335 RepID=A0ACC4CGW2_POPAL
MENYRLDAQSAAEKAVSVIGFGYDLTKDIRLSSCKPGPFGSRLIELDLTRNQELFVPDVREIQSGNVFIRFIDKYGTHVVVGVKMGGKDVIHIKQLQNSNLEPPEVQKIVKGIC